MSSASEMPPVQIVQQQLDAFNSHDLDAFCALCHPEITIEDADSSPLLHGLEDLRDWYAAQFADNPDLKADLLDRISVGEWVIDENLVTGFANGSQLHMVVTMLVIDEQIRLMRVIR